MRAPALALALLCSAAAQAIEPAGSARLWLGGGIDTNPRRDYVSSDVTTPLDGVLSAILNLAGSLEAENGRASGLYDLGGRKFVLYPSEDTVVQSLLLDGQLYLGRGFALELTARGRDRRGADREYTDLAGDALLSYQPDSFIDLRLRGTAHRFVYWSRFAVSFGAGEAGLSARYRFSRHHSVMVASDVSLRQYNAQTTSNPNDAEPPPTVQRRDTVLSASASYTYRGPVNLTLTYGYLDSTSNSFGESYRQHRVSLLVGVALPWKLTFLLNGTLRLMQYPDGVYLSPDLQVSEDDENMSSVSVKLVRPIGDHLDLDVRYIFLYGRLPTNQLGYQRHVATLGVSVHF